jgi:hypothetical protein
MTNESPGHQADRDHESGDVNENTMTQHANHQADETRLNQSSTTTPFAFDPDAESPLSTSPSPE